MTDTERNTLVDMVAQAVIDKMDERERVNSLADLVVKRVMTLMEQEAQLKAANEQETRTDGTE